MKLRRQEKNKWNEDDLSSSDWLGEVVENDDPLKAFRCKVKIWGKFDSLTNDLIPWAYPQSNVFANTDGGGNGSVPKKGTVVRVNFLNGDLYSPQYTGIPNLNKAMISEIGGSYLDSHVLLYDEVEDLKLFYTPGVGFRFYFKGSQLTINSDKSITLEYDGSTSIVELADNNITITANQKVEVTTNQDIEMNSAKITVNGKLVAIGDNPVFSAALSEPLWTFLLALATATDAKWPPTPGAMAGLAQSSQILATSKTISVSI